MKKILKQHLITGQNGKVLNRNSERLTDNGRGMLNVTTRSTSIQCPNCRRPVTDINKLRGKCDICRTQTCCEHCETRCRVCSRKLCGHCRRGFVGQSSTITVCPICLNYLRQRQAFNDRLLIQKIRHQRQIMHQREAARLHALRLQAAGIRSRNQVQIANLKSRNRIQAAKAQIGGKLALLREINKLRIALLKERRNCGQRSYRTF